MSHGLSSLSSSSCSACLDNLSTSLKVISNMASLLFCSGELLNETTAVCSVPTVMFRLMIVRMRPESGNSTYVTGRRPTRALEVQ